MSRKSLLIIGGTGVLSTAVVSEALRQGLKVTIINRGNRMNIIPHGVELIKSDVHDRPKVESLLVNRHFDTVIDFICFNKKQIEYSFDLFKNYASQYVFISSACVYDTTIPGLKDEDSPKVLKDWNYSVNKWDCEEYLKKKGEEANIPYTIVRPCITYDNTRIPYGIVPPYGYHWTFVSRILCDKPIITWDLGKARWNMMRVEDFAVGVCSIIGNKAAFGEVFNISGDVAYSWEDVLCTLEDILKKKITRVDIPSSVYRNLDKENSGRICGRSMDLIVSNAKIKGLCPQFGTKIGLREGLEMTLESYKSHNYQKGIDWKYDANVDRIIRQWCTKNKIEIDTHMVSYMDYLGNATFCNRIEYWLTYHELRSLYIFPVRIWRKLLKIFKKDIQYK